jgi:hypothetical protein
VLIADISPYETLYTVLEKPKKIMIDGNVRAFISQGLLDLDVELVPLSPEISRDREIKSRREIAILRAVYHYHPCFI